MSRLAVFDLDGTLIDSKRDLANAANALVSEFGGHPISEEDVAAMVGEGVAVLVQRVLAASRLAVEVASALPRFLKLYDERLIEHTRPYDGIIEMLEGLFTRMPLAVLTNKPQAATGRILSALDLERFFGHVIGGDTALGRKPDPAGLEALAERCGVGVGSTVLVGDSPIDLETARRAGSRIVLVSYGFGFRQVPLRSGEQVVSEPAAIIPLLES